MDEKLFINRLKEIINIFSTENFYLAIDKAKELKKELNDDEEKLFVENIIKIIQATLLLNQQNIGESLELLESAYFQLKNFRPNYKGLKVENLLNNINQSISEIKKISKK